jgi:hypothetical protein
MTSKLNQPLRLPDAFWAAYDHQVDALTSFERTQNIAINRLALERALTILPKLFASEGGKARAKKLSKRRRVEIAKLAVAAREAKRYRNKP